MVIDFKNYFEEVINLWSKPEMIVLVRNRPEEILTTGCKNVPDTGAGNPDGIGDQGCTGAEPGNCGNCQARDSAT